MNSGLRKNVHLLRCPSPASTTYLSVRLIPRGKDALHLGIFAQPGERDFFNTLTGGRND